MAKIKSPNKEYTGLSAGVPFAGGEGQTDNPHLIMWFKEHGYTVLTTKAERKALGLTEDDKDKQDEDKDKQDETDNGSKE